jgi:hypothetical protein
MTALPNAAIRLATKGLATFLLVSPQPPWLQSGSSKYNGILVRHTSPGGFCGHEGGLSVRPLPAEPREPQFPQSNHNSGMKGQHTVKPAPTLTPLSHQALRDMKVKNVSRALCSLSGPGSAPSSHSLEVGHRGWQEE